MTPLEFAKQQKRKLDEEKQLLEDLAQVKGSAARDKVLEQSLAKWNGKRPAPSWLSSFSAANEGSAGAEYVRVKLQQIKADLLVVARVLESEQRSSRRARR